MSSNKNNSIWHTPVSKEPRKPELDAEPDSGEIDLPEPGSNVPGPGDSYWFPLAHGRDPGATVLRDIKSRYPSTVPLPQGAALEVIEEEQRIVRILRALTGNQSTGFVRKEHADPQPVVAKRYDPKADLAVSWETRGPVPDPPFSIEVVGYNSVYQIDVEALGAEDDRCFCTAAPQRIIRLRFRSEKRVSAPADMEIEFYHPVITNRRIRRSLHDISYNGISFAAASAKDMMLPGLEIFGAAVKKGGKTVWQGNGIVKRVTKLPEAPKIDDCTQAICGLTIKHQTREDRSFWQHLVSDELCPNTQTGGVWSDLLWDVYKKSGYFSLSEKSPAHFFELKDAFANVCRKLDAAPRLGCHVVWPGEQEIEATSTIVKVYQNTSFGFHTAKVPGVFFADGVPGRQLLRETHFRLHDHLQNIEDLHWHICYVQTKSRWPRLAFRDFPLRYVETGRTSITRFRALEFSCSTVRTPLPPKLEVGPATPEEIGTLLWNIAQNRPKPYVEALDLIPQRFNLSSLKEEWTKAGLERERAVLVARERGTPVAAAVLEIGEKGVHLFNLLDCVRLYALFDGAETYFVALLDEARRWYAERGKETFICLLEEVDTGLREILKACKADLGEADMIAMPSDLLPDFQEHIFEITGPSKI